MPVTFVRYTETRRRERGGCYDANIAPTSEFIANDLAVKTYQIWGQAHLGPIQPFSREETVHLADALFAPSKPAT